VNLFLVLPSCKSPSSWRRALPTTDVADDLEESSRLRFVIESPEPQPRQAGRQKEEEKLTKRSEEGAKPRGEEGRMGKKDAPSTAGQSRPRAIDPNAKDIVKDSGLVGLLRRGAELSTVFGSAGLGGDLRAIVGNMSGPVVADSDGLGGLSIRGSGTGGGGQGTIRIGAIGTKGLGRGIRDEGSLTITNKRVHEPIIDVTPRVRGSVDKELIRKVIGSRRADPLLLRAAAGHQPEAPGQGRHHVDHRGRRLCDEREGGRLRHHHRGLESPRVHDVPHRELDLSEAHGRRRRHHHVPVDPPRLRRAIGR
jgi:hypothetical protein